MSFSELNILEPVPESLHERYDVVNLRGLCMVLKTSEWDSVVKNVNRMLKPGGYIVWTDTDPGSGHALPATPIATKVGDVFGYICRMRGGDPFPTQNLPTHLAANNLALSYYMRIPGSRLKAETIDSFSDIFVVSLLSFMSYMAQNNIPNEWFTPETSLEFVRAFQKELEGTDDVAREIVDVLVASAKHEIILLSRKDASTDLVLGPTCTWARVDYEDINGLTEALRSVHTVLCFITPQSDPGNSAQKSLINAAVEAGVKRYAPSEWATSSFEYMPWYAGKGEIRTYLKELNKDRKVLEYCLFLPGMFVNYYTAPYKTSQHVHPFENQIDFEKRRAIVLKGGEDSRISLITVKDFCNMVAKAVDYEGEWPLIGGIRGDELTVEQLVAVGTKVRGKPFAIEEVEAEDLKAGVVKTTWLPKIDHPAIPAEQVNTLAASFLSGALLGMSAGAFSVSDEWNKLIPGYEMTRAEDFLADAWRDKP
ncbi:hypothetical protein ABW21_db0203258 [Orbilia brochopaga]|nr:hypothetical protein ABW21_db0203258 [Drechslerella brochopaga]